MTADMAHSRTAMKRLAGALSFVCLVLFLLAIEQKQTVEAWETMRAGSGPAARRVADWAGELPLKAAGAFEGLRSAVARQSGSRSDARVVEAGRPAAGATAAAVGSLTLVRAELHFGNGEVLRTRPLRIARGRDAFAPGQTFGARLAVPDDAQIELREVVAAAPGRPVPPSSLFA
ncbi:MAG: hypothetical protein K0M78_10475, partial [Brevundimonas sp.]|nr:hypothetical protein [Brevundimonas sp.]